MRTIRSFIAIPLAAEIQRDAVRLIDRLRQESDGIKWVPADNLHLTLKFLGDVENTEVPQVCDVLHRIAAHFDPFDLVFAGTGGFPTIERPRVLWIGVQDQSGALCRLVGQLEAALADLGFKPEPRDYRPHLTLGRTRSSRRRASDLLVEQIQEFENRDFGRMTVSEIRLMASFLDKRGPTYQVMDTVEI